MTVVERLLGVLGDAGHFIRPDRTSRLLAQFIETPSKHEQMEIIRKLAHQGDRTAVESLATLARSDHRLAFAATDALEAIPTRSAETALLDFVASSDTEVAVRACRWMAAHGSERALPALVAVLDTRRLPEELELAARGALERIEFRVQHPDAMEGRVSVVERARESGELGVLEEEAGALSES